MGPAPFFVMGIVNVTPDSFSDGGHHATPDAAVAHGLELAAQGADILDIGGESTRPFAEPLPLSDELLRVLPVIQGILAAFFPPYAKPPKVLEGGGRDASSILPSPTPPVLSVDTYKSEVARQALEAGADIVNDVSACAFDPGLLDVVAQMKPGYVLMHSLGRPATMQVEPRYDDVVADVFAFFESRLAMLAKAGLPEDRVVLDPGIGFGKTLAHNVALIRNIGKFLTLGRPVLMGLSNKSFLGGLSGLGVADRALPTQVATALAFRHGASIHRVHRAADTRLTLKLATELA